jgi:hypothetical protein
MFSFHLRLGFPVSFFTFPHQNLSSLQFSLSCDVTNYTKWSILLKTCGIIVITVLKPVQKYEDTKKVFLLGGI